MFRRMAIVPLLAVLLASCGQAAAPAGAPTAPSSPPAAAQGGAVSPQFAFSEAVVGRNRIAIGLLRDGTPVNDPAAKVHLRFYDLADQSAQVKFEADARYFGQGLPAGFYVAYPTFDTAGNWGIEIQTQLPGQTQPSASRLRLEVKPKSDMPNVGQPAIATKTATIADTPDTSRLSSGTPVNPAMYQISLDAALQSGKPTALLFATPAFCASATCGPSLQVLEGLQKTYGDRMNFIHVEVYKYPFGESAGKADLSAPMVAWGLKSEPWLYLIDAKGTIAARFEGGITQEELGPALEKLIAGQSVVLGS
jgi:hypothetical protein